MARANEGGGVGEVSGGEAAGERSGEGEGWRPHLEDLHRVVGEVVVHDEGAELAIERLAVVPREVEAQHLHAEWRRCSSAECNAAAASGVGAPALRCRASRVRYTQRPPQETQASRSDGVAAPLESSAGGRGRTLRSYLRNWSSLSGPSKVDEQPRRASMLPADGRRGRGEYSSATRAHDTRGGVALHIARTCVCNTVAHPHPSGGRYY